MKEDNPYSLTGETAMITGGGTGIGLGIANCMLKAGAEKVILVGRREEVLSQAVAGLGSRASYIVHDITDIDRMEAFRDRVAAEHGDQCRPQVRELDPFQSSSGHGRGGGCTRDRREARRRTARGGTA